MDNLTNNLLTFVNQYSINESLKNGLMFRFDNGNTQRMGNKNIVYTTLTLSYNNINCDVYKFLEFLYQNYFATTFLLNLPNEEDIRQIVDTSGNSSVWAMADFNFTVNANTWDKYKGSITLVSSVFFNYPKYQDLYQNAVSKYHYDYSNDFSFINEVLKVKNPKSINFRYITSMLKATVGRATQFQISKLGTVQSWDMSFYLNELQYRKLLRFYRSKGVSKSFGMPKLGFYRVNDTCYGACSDDTCDLGSGFSGANCPPLCGNTKDGDCLIPSKFNQDEIKRIRLNNGMYQVSLSIIQDTNFVGGYDG